MTSRVDGVAAADVFDGLECAATGEHGHPCEEPLFGSVQQVVGPVDGRAKSCVALDRAASRTGQHVESSIETLDEFGRAHRDDPGGGQFDGQWDSIQALAGLDDGSGRCCGLRRSPP